jgi:multidrug efflux system membrane fusion protein
MVPAEAVQLGREGHFVFIINDDNTVTMRPVRPGQKHGSEMVILDGVQAGEKVVVTGQITLSPGASVRVVNR